MPNYIVNGCFSDARADHDSDGSIIQTGIVLCMLYIIYILIRLPPFSDDPACFVCVLFCFCPGQFHALPEHY